MSLNCRDYPFSKLVNGIERRREVGKKFSLSYRDEEMQLENSNYSIKFDLRIFTQLGHVYRLINFSSNGERRSFYLGVLKILTEIEILHSTMIRIMME